MCRRSWERVREPSLTHYRCLFLSVVHSIRPSHSQRGMLVVPCMHHFAARLRRFVLKRQLVPSYQLLCGICGLHKIDPLFPPGSIGIAARQHSQLRTLTSALRARSTLVLASLAGFSSSHACSARPIELLRRLVSVLVRLGHSLTETIQ